MIFCPECETSLDVEEDEVRKRTQTTRKKKRKTVTIRKCCFSPSLSFFAFLACFALLTISALCRQPKYYTLPF